MGYCIVSAVQCLEPQLCKQHTETQCKYNIKQLEYPFSPWFGVTVTANTLHLSLCSVGDSTLLLLLIWDKR